MDVNIGILKKEILIKDDIDNIYDEINALIREKKTGQCEHFVKEIDALWTYCNIEKIRIND